MLTRYTLPRMGAIWSEENKFRKWLEVELLALEALAGLGVVPREAVEAARTRAGFDVAEIAEFEKETRHDVVAFLQSVSRRLGDEARYIHLGLTSYDVVDTALAVLLSEAADVLLDDLRLLREAIREKAVEHRNTLMVGRTHGVHAEPTTFGLKLLVWLAETDRNIERIRRAKSVVGVGKLSGAVGTYATVDPRVEEFVCARLGLKPAAAATQILQRDRHADYLCSLAVVAGSVEKFATEVRGLQRTEILEVEEPFGGGQKGSSAMPHKRNPVVCERICGLARVVRSNALAALENMALWHERDISHSAAERLILPESAIVLDYMLQSFARVMRELRVYPENMRKNLEKTGGLVFSQRVMLALTEKGMARDAAYAVAQRNAMRAWESGEDFRRLLAQDPDVRSVLGDEELAACFDYGYYLRHVDELFRRFGL